MDFIVMEKLSGSNYLSWSKQTQTLLTGKGLWEVVESGVASVDPTSTDDSPGESSAEAVADTGSKSSEASPNRTAAQDVRARNAITGLCAPSVLHHIQPLATAKEQWDALRTLYLGPKHLMPKLLAFVDYRPRERGATIDDIASKLDLLQSEIAAIDPAERPSNAMKKVILFRSVKDLGPRFEPLIRQLNLSNAAIDYDALVTHLKEFEQRLGPKEA